MKQMQFQRCPNCRERNDVSVYVQGQLTRCVRCSIRFAVDRGQVTPPPERPVESPTDVSVLRNGAVPPPPVAEPPPVPLTSGQLFPTPAERPGPARSPDSAPRTPDGKPVIPGYECTQLLGRGGMGEVWRARQISLDRPVAVKILSPTLAVEPDFIRRFERESSALATLAHPHVVGVYDRGSANGHWYFVMEFVEGRSLRERVTEVNVQRTEILRLLGQVARAMEYAHRKGVIHRDLKPENVLIDHVGHAKVADFGLAGMAESGRSSLTMTAVAMGTAHYMAPEQRRDAKNVDGRADLYSLGVMLYEILCAEVPAGRFPSPREKVPDIDPRLDAMIMRLLDQDPDRRPSSATEVADLLESLAEGKTEADRPIPRPPPRTQSWSAVARDFASFTFWQKAMLAGAAVLFVAIVTIAIVRGGPAGRQREHFSAKVDKPAPGSSVWQITPGESGMSRALLAVGPGWSVTKSELVRDAEPKEAPGERAPRAYVLALRSDLDNADVTADVTFQGMSGNATGDQGPSADLLLYRDQNRYVGIHLAPHEEPVASLFYPPGAKRNQSSVASTGRDRVVTATSHYQVRLTTSKGSSVKAYVDGKQILTGDLALPGIRAKLAFGCRNARCRFSNIKVAGLVIDETPAVSQK